MTKLSSLVKKARPLLLATLLGGAAFLGGCGGGDAIVLVSVSGLDSTITELHVTMTLDGVMAKNSQPTPDDPDANSFSVYKDMQRFAIDMPMGTQLLSLNVDGLNTVREVVKTASAMLDLRQSTDLDVALHKP